MAARQHIGETPLLQLSLASRLDEIERLADEVEVACADHALPARSAYLFNLCFDELITNIIMHGLNNAPNHVIDVALFLQDDWLRGTIIDDGPPFDPLAMPAPDIHASLEDRAIGGLGTHFVRTLMDEVGYRHENGRNHFMLGHHLAGPANGRKNDVDPDCP